jgi:hypothetical protein
MPPKFTAVYFQQQVQGIPVDEVSNNNGASWVRVETVNFTGTENQWLRRSFRVGDYVTPTAQVRIRFGTADNPNDSICEAGVDHIVIRRIVCP